MIKGCQKRVLWVKNIESDCFDGAFFIVSDKSGEKLRSESSMVAEANRIISQSAITNYFGVEKGSQKKQAGEMRVLKIKWFAVGAMIMTALSLFVRFF